MNKNFNKLFTATFLTITLVFATQNYGMNNFRQRFMPSWKTATLGAFAGGCTLAHYCIAYPQAIIEAPNIVEYITETHPDFVRPQDADPFVQKFVTQHLQSKALDDSKPLKIKYSWEYWAASAIKNNYLCIPRKLKHTLKKYYSASIQAQDKDILEKYLIESISSIQHEGTHLVNRDFLRMLLAATIIPLSIEAITFGLKRIIPYKQIRFKNISKIPTGFIKLGFNSCSILAFSRYCEQKADDGIIDNIHLLNADKEFFERQKNVPFLTSLFMAHPTPAKRAKKLRQRIEALKATGNPDYWRNPLEIQTPQNPLDHKESERK